jgi:hypothetical protein
MKKVYYYTLFILVLLLISFVAISQNPHPLRTDVSVDYIMDVDKECARIAKDPVSGKLFFINAKGKVYRINNLNNSPQAELLYTSADHGIVFLQGMAFSDSTLFLIGNTKVDSTGNYGIIKKAVLRANGNREWFTVAKTEIYQQSYTWYDHGFSGITVSPDKNYLFISSGSRTDHGEEQNNGGLYPGMREVPLTSAVFRIPANSVNLTLQNNDAALASYLWADGTRNSFDMAFDANGKLFACENSGDRDDPDEFNLIQQGKHYGFPWVMGGNDNPTRFSGYDPNNDKLLNKKCNAYLKGYYHDDPGFPQLPSTPLTAGIKNLGPDADMFREPSGSVSDGSDSQNNVRTFTPHRSPLGLSFDKQNILIPDFKGDGFLVSFTRGGDETGLDSYGYPGVISDDGQDLLHIKLTPDGSGSYEMHATTIVKGFNYPVDTYLDENILYVIEHSQNNNGRLFKVTLPLDVTAVDESHTSFDYSVYPNPSNGVVAISAGINNACQLNVFNCFGEKVFQQCIAEPRDKGSKINLSALPKGMYFFELSDGNRISVKKVLLQ